MRPFLFQGQFAHSFSGAFFVVRILPLPVFGAVENQRGDFSSFSMIVKASYLQSHVITKKAENQGEKRTPKPLPQDHVPMESFC
jgi:hypothetical protein